MTPLGKKDQELQKRLAASLYKNVILKEDIENAQSLDDVTKSSSRSYEPIEEEEGEEETPQRDNSGGNRDSPTTKPQGTCLVFYDFETRQDKEIAADMNGSRFQHVVNFAGAQYVCNPCTVKGVKQPNCAHCELVTFSGDDSLKQFCEWLLKQKDARAVAHNAGGFDAHFITDFLLRHGIPPTDCVYRGMKLLRAAIPNNIILMDSINFIPGPLSSFPKMFGLKELKKGYFPHFFNTKPNWQYRGRLPEKSYYGPQYMKPQAREEFEQWHEKHQNDFFDFQVELHAYCVSDVNILCEGIMKFRQLFSTCGEVDILMESLTIAGNCPSITSTYLSCVCHLISNSTRTLVSSFRM